MVIYFISRSIGYDYESDGAVEKQDKYLRRMSGYMRLYAAITISQPLRNSGQVSTLDKLS